MSLLIGELKRTMLEAYKNPDGNLFSHQDFFSGKDSYPSGDFKHLHDLNGKRIEEKND